MNVGRIEISNHKVKSLKLILGGICLIGIAIFVIMISEEQQMLAPFLVEIIGYLLLLFMIPSLIYVLYKLSDNSPRIILDSAGITDHSSATSPGFIPWRDIEGFEIKTVYSTQLLGFILKDPKDFYKSSKPISRFLNRLNSHMFKSHWMISVNTLKVEFDEFTELVRTYHQNYS